MITPVSAQFQEQEGLLQQTPKKNIKKGEIPDTRNPIMPTSPSLTYVSTNMHDAPPADRHPKTGEGRWDAVVRRW